MEQFTPLLTFIASLIAAGASIYNARLAHFAKQRWWERKADADSRIIEAFSSLAYYYEEYLDAEIEGRRIPDARRPEIDEHWKRGYVEVKRATAAGAFLISSEAEHALTTFWKEKDKGVHPDDWYRMMDSNYAAVQTCLRDVVAAAKKDLAV